MKLNAFLSYALFLTLLVGCGEDVSSNRKLGSPLVDRPTIETAGVVGLSSQLHRERGAPVLTSAQEISRISSNDLPVASYRTIPLMEKDDEGSNRSVTTRNDLGRPTVTCGLATTLTGIDSRINDCFQKNADKSLWEGFRFGSAGEGIWKLVSRTDAGLEIWLDNRTGLVWSDLVTTSENVNTFNWCKASGNDDLPTSPATINCSELMDQTRVCQDLFIEGLGANVAWRLPTRNDFLQADINGARFVLKRENNSGLWTATMRAAATGRTEAWVYNSTDGTLSAGNLTSERQVRCVGAAIR